MLKRLKEYFVRSQGSRRKKQKEYFTIVILPGPNSRVRRYSFSKTLLRNLGFAALAVCVLSFGMFGEYFHMCGEVWELNSLRSESAQQKKQLMAFAGSIVDMKAQMAGLKALSDRLSQAAGIGGKRQQVLGIGGTPEMSTLNLDELGRKTHEEMVEQMSQELAGLKDDASRQQVSMARLYEYFDHRNSVLASTPSIWPVHGFITSDFGRRRSPIYGTAQFHEGLDIANAVGTPVVAPANGTVVEEGYSTGGYGQFIKIQHGYGLTTLYGHLSKILVHDGQRVKKGDRIGLIGNTGNSTGPHLHYEVWVNGVPVNPRKYI